MHRYLERASSTSESEREVRRRVRNRRREAIQRMQPIEVLNKLKNSRARHNYAYACEYTETHAIDESQGGLVGGALDYVVENGAAAWAFAPEEENRGVQVTGGTEIEFAQAVEQTLLANLQFPNEQRVYYFEVRLDSVPEGTDVAVGVAMRAYPPLRMAGWAPNSVAYHSVDGRTYFSHPLDACRRCPRARTSDTVGIGWRPCSGKLFVALNGAIVCHLRTPWAQCRLFPAVSADGPCRLSVNAGARAFVLAHANMRYWGLGPAEGAKPPPPAYAQHVADSVFLDESSRRLEEEQSYVDLGDAADAALPSYEPPGTARRLKREGSVDADVESLAQSSLAGLRILAPETEAEAETEQEPPLLPPASSAASSGDEDPCGGGDAGAPCASLGRS
ncbi:Protein ssh4 [Coemansia sp. Benny D115]|nr:Protein ssh4 [Coemansia sp. Benny D115]